MSIAPTLQQYLVARNIEYDVITHEPTLSSSRTAEACRISGDRLAKGIVLLRDGGYALAVLPASHHIRLSDLRSELGDNVAIAQETDVSRLFPDCAHGAVPPVGECYGLPLIVDDSIEALPDIYIEAGDHETLLHLDHAQFAYLTTDARHGRFSAKLPERAKASSRGAEATDDGAVRRMRETDIHDYARQLLEAHGDKAIAEVAQRACACQEQHQDEDAETWRRIEAAMKLMRGPHAS
jgi:Ala-tRNA(Pro) deacylase